MNPDLYNNYYFNSPQLLQFQYGKSSLDCSPNGMIDDIDQYFISPLNNKGLNRDNSEENSNEL